MADKAKGTLGKRRRGGKRVFDVRLTMTMGNIFKVKAKDEREALAIVERLWAARDDGGIEVPYDLKEGDVDIVVLGESDYNHG